jgi:hypothetical protein
MFRRQISAVIIPAMFLTTACQRNYNANKPSVATLTTAASTPLEADVQGFVETWFAGFDSHESALFFLQRLSSGGFSIEFPGQAPIRSARDFQAWLAGVDPLQRVTHTLRTVEVKPLGPTSVLVDLRVDWSAWDKEKPLFFPAQQRWNLEKDAAGWKIKSYVVSEAQEARYHEIQESMKRFFANYGIIAQQGWDRFVETQTQLLASNVVVYNHYGNQEFTYFGPTGYFASLQAWGARFATEGEFGFEPVAVGPDSAVVKINSVLRFDGQLVKHCWIEKFSFDAQGKITRLDVLMNESQSCTAAQF